MQIAAHLGISWLTGEVSGLESRRDRRIVGLAGIAPDSDALIYPLAYFWYLGDLNAAFSIYAAIHHRYTHGIVFALIAAAVAFQLASPAMRLRVTLLAFAAVIIHIICDGIAAGTDWPIYPLMPFSDLSWTVSWSWDVSDWRNIALSIAAIAMALAYSWKKRYSPLECISYQADNWLAAVLHGEAQSSPRFRIAIYSLIIIITAAIALPILILGR